MNEPSLDMQDNNYITFMSSIISLEHNIKGEVLTFVIIFIFFVAKMVNLKVISRSYSVLSKLDLIMSLLALILQGCITVITICTLMPTTKTDSSIANFDFAYKILNGCLAIILLISNSFFLKLIKQTKFFRVFVLIMIITSVMNPAFIIMIALKPEVKIVNIIWDWANTIMSYVNFVAIIFYFSAIDLFDSKFESLEKKF